MTGRFKAVAKAVLPVRVWNMLRRRRLQHTLDSFRGRVVEHRYLGQSLRINIRDALGEAWYDHDWEQRPEITRLQASRLSPGATVFDCGAHQGVVALILAKIVGPSGHVVAVEANRHNVIVAQSNEQLNPGGRAAVTIVHAAVASNDGELSFNEDLNGQLQHQANTRTGTQTVPAVTLNTLRTRFGQPDVVYLDIEGAEAMALKAADQLLTEGQRPDWFVEVHSGHGLEALGGSIEELMTFFHNYGYTLEWCEESAGQFRPLDKGAVSGRFYLVATAQGP